MEHVPLFEYSEQEPSSEGALAKALANDENLMAWEVDHQECPACQEQIIFLQNGRTTFDYEDHERVFRGVDEDADFTEYLIWPRSVTKHCPRETPKALHEDFKEAAAVLPISAKASAALSRRCLQHLLRDYGGTKAKDLSKQIDEIVASGALAHNLSEQLDAVRVIGNFAAHVQKSTNSGEILDVEPEEAEWNLEVLEELFEHYFVKPERNRQRKERLKQKLELAGKQPILDR